jgi:hypothetical protein
MENNIPDNPLPIQPPNNPTPPEQTTMSIPPVEKPKSKHRFLKIFLVSIVVFFIFVLVAGWFLLQQLNTKLAPKGSKVSLNDLQQFAQDIKNKKSVPGTVITHSQTSGQDNVHLNGSPSQTNTGNTQNDTSSQANWNTYENSGYKFSINFPSDLKLTDKPQGFGVTTIELKALDATSADGSDYQILIFPKALAKMAGVDFDSDYALSDNSTRTLTDTSGNPQTYTKILNRTVGSLRAYDFKNSPPSADSQAAIGTAIEIGDSVLMISTGESNKAELESMLATFKYPI